MGPIIVNREPTDFEIQEEQTERGLIKSHRNQNPEQRRRREMANELNRKDRIANEQQLKKQNSFGLFYFNNNSMMGSNSRTNFANGYQDNYEPQNSRLSANNSRVALQNPYPYLQPPGLHQSGGGFNQNVYTNRENNPNSSINAKNLLPNTENNLLYS